MRILHNFLHIVQALAPIKVAVEALCSRVSDFVTSEATMKFLLDEMQNYPLQSTTMESLKQLTIEIFRNAISKLQ